MLHLVVWCLSLLLERCDVLPTFAEHCRCSVVGSHCLFHIGDRCWSSWDKVVLLLLLFPFEVVINLGEMDNTLIDFSALCMYFWLISFRLYICSSLSFCLYRAWAGTKVYDTIWVCTFFVFKYFYCKLLYAFSFSKSGSRGLDTIFFFFF